MGTWGPSIFSSDLAADVRGDFRELIEDGASATAATTRVLEQYAEVADDSDEGTVFWTALAAVQMKLGRLETHVRDRAIALIDAGGDLHLWNDTKHAAARRNALDRLKAELQGPQRDPVRVRRPIVVPSPVAVGQLVALPLLDGREARLHVLALDRSRYGEWPVVELVDDRGRPYKTQQPLTRRWIDPAQMEVVARRRKDLPTDLRVLAEDVGERSEPVFTRSYLGWDTLRDFCAGLLDTPEAQPDP